MAGLGPKPRINLPSQGQSGADLQFFTPPTGAMQPPASQPHQSVQPPTAPFPQSAAPQPMQQPFQTMSTSGLQPVGGTMQPGIFPSASHHMSSRSSSYDDIENEPPLLEELGINVDHIVMRMKGVAFFKHIEEDVLDDLDLSGPIAILVALATCLLFAGKISFSSVYGFGLSGCIGIWMLINVMSQKGGIDLYRTMSILGYGLIPTVILAALGVFVSLKSTFGTVISAVCIFWSTATTSRFFATAIAMHQQRWLVAYPVGLFYTCFTLLTVF